MAEAVEEQHGGEGAPGARVGIDRAALYVELGDLAERAQSRAGLMRGALGALGSAFGALHGVLYAQLRADVVEEGFSAEAADPAFWKPALDGLLNDVMADGAPAGRLYRARGSGVLVAALAAGLPGETGETLGAVALVVPTSGEAEARAQQATLESAVHLLAGLSQRLEARESRGQDREGLRAAADIARVAGFSSPRELAYAITNNLRNATRCEQVALGLVHGARVEVLSVSGYDEVKSQSEGVQILQAAMGECLDAGTPVLVQAGHDPDGPTPADWKLHRRWLAQSGASAVASIPIGPVAGTTVVLSVRRQTGSFDAADVAKMTRMVEPLVGAFSLVERATRSLRTHAADAAAGAAGWLREPGRNARRVGVGLALLAAAWFLFGPLPYSISAPATVLPAEVQELGAPYEAVLDTAPAVAGDRVEEGQVLATFRSEELQLERDKLQAELEVQRYGASRAMAERRPPVEVRLAQAQVDLLRAQIALLDQQIAQATVRAPFDGVVTSGDLRQRIGQTFQLGAPLFRVAQGDRWEIRVDVPERAVDDVAEGQVGTFASEARPDQTETFALRRVSPGAEVVNGRNVYAAEAEVEIAAPWMRPGMQGVARIDAGTRVAWWVLLHRVTDWLWLHFWL